MDDEITLPGQTLPLLPLTEEDADELLLHSADELRDRYPLSRIERNEARLAGIVQLLGANAPVRMICRSYHISPHTLSSIRAKHAQRVATVKQSIARRMAMFVELGIDRLIDEVDKIDPDKLAISVGIITDKLQVLTGEASVIVGRPEDSGPRYTLEGLQAKLKQVGSGTGFGVGEESQQGAARVAIEVEGELVDQVPSAGVVDSQSIPEAK